VLIEVNHCWFKDWKAADKLEIRVEVVINALYGSYNSSETWDEPSLTIPAPKGPRGETRNTCVVIYDHSAELQPLVCDDLPLWRQIKEEY